MNKTPEQIVDHLTLNSYCYQRDLYGMSAKSAATIFSNADKLEAAYQQRKKDNGHINK